MDPRLGAKSCRIQFCAENVGIEPARNRRMNPENPPRFYTLCKETEWGNNNAQNSSLLLWQRGVLREITHISPHPKEKCSILLKRTNVPITYLNDIRPLVESHKEKAPGADGTAQGSSS